MEKITDIEHLRKLANAEDCGYGVDVFISFGAVRSSKNVRYINGWWHIYNEIDGTIGSYKNDKSLGSYTNIVKAIESGCLYKHE